jgi:hypothetical protein
MARAIRLRIVFIIVVLFLFVKLIGNYTLFIIISDELGGAGDVGLFVQHELPE